MLELYGNYYKLFKGHGTTPQKITVVAIDGYDVTYIMGHYSKDELLSRGDTVDEAIRNMCLVKNKCNVSKILTQATKKQIEALHKEEKRIKRMIVEMDRANTGRWSKRFCRKSIRRRSIRSGLRESRRIN